MKYQKEEIQRFKYLLEYFVAHLEYIANDYSDSSLGYEKYIKPLVDRDTFKYSGQGYNGQGIQTQISEWDQYKNGQICINVYGANYQSRATYLNWQGTGNNIMADWQGKHIDCLYLQYYDPDTGERLPQNVSSTIKELGLYDNQIPNETLCNFFDKYNNMIEKFKNKQHHMKMDKYIELLKANHNLILTGAPGTGKTFMAKDMASQMILGKAYSEIVKGEEEQDIFNHYCQFVQFHPSYDYTDFVEGLRPINDTDGNIGFKRKDGVFKEFCKRSFFNDRLMEQEDVFEPVYKGIMSDIEKGKLKHIKTPYGSYDVEVEKGRIVYGNDKRTESKENLKLMYEHFFRKNQFDLSDFQKDDYWQLIENLTSGKTKTCDYVYYSGILQKMLERADKIYVDDDTPYIFIIDEINRGEISKIFGELFFSIDPGYRGEYDENGNDNKVQTQYQNLIPKEGDKDFDPQNADVFRHGFYVPENVYIIGTMNDIDRSVESMDFAMRRRFAWQEVTAEESYANMIENDSDFVLIKDEIKQRMFSLNKAIAETEGMDEAYQIGAAYFRKYLDYQDKENPFECLWNNHLKGLLFEYLRGNRRAKDLLEKLHKAYNKTSIDEQSAHTSEG